MNWPIVPLGEIAKSVDYGLTASASDRPVGPKFLRITDIQDEAVDWDSVPYCVADTGQIVRSQLADGDIVFARTGATTGKSFLVRNPPNEAVFASYLIRVRSNERIDPVFLSYFFRSPNYWSQIGKAARGAAQPGVNASVLKELAIPLPPLPEQRRIAAILEKAEGIHRRRQSVFAVAAQFLSSVFIELFGDPAANPKRWPIVTIRDLVTEVRYGTSKKADETDGQYPILRMGNITYSGELDLSDLKFITLNKDEVTKYTVRMDDIIFNRTNSKELVGKTTVFDQTTPYAFAGYLVRARANVLADPYYISGYLNSAYGKARLRSMCKSIIGMANINAQEFQNISIPHPPLGIQKRYRAVIDRTKQHLITARAAREQASDLFTALSQRAFRGEL